jgi:hypothetical protein
MRVRGEWIGSSMVEPTAPAQCHGDARATRGNASSADSWPECPADVWICPMAMCSRLAYVREQRVW